MFIDRPDVVDQFASAFRSTADGQILFQPGDTEVGLPITQEEYDMLLAAFEAQTRRNMLLSWVAWFGALGFGGYKLLTEDSFIPFSIAFGIAFAWTFSLHMRDGLGLLLPLIQRRDELEEATKAQQVR